MAFFVVLPAAITYYGAAALGAGIASAIGVTGLSAAATFAIGAGTISAGFTALKGGSPEDILKSAILSGATSYIGGTIGKDIASNVRAEAIMSGDLSFTAADTVGRIASSATVGAISSGLSALAGNKDPLDAFVKGGLTAAMSTAVGAGVDSVLSDVPGFEPTNDKMKSTLQRAAKAALGTTILTGGDTEKIKGSVMNSFMGSFNLKEAVANARLKDTSAEVTTANEAFRESERNYTKNLEQQDKLISEYNNQLAPLQDLESSLTNAYSQYTATVDNYKNYDAFMLSQGYMPTNGYDFDGNIITNYIKYGEVIGKETEPGFNEDGSPAYDERGNRLYFDIRAPNENAPAELSQDAILAKANSLAEQVNTLYPKYEELKTNLVGGEVTKYRTETQQQYIETYDGGGYYDLVEVQVPYQEAVVGSLTPVKQQIDKLQDDGKILFSVLESNKTNLTSAVETFQKVETENTEIVKKQLDAFVTANDMYAAEFGAAPTEDQLKTFAKNGDIVGAVNKAIVENRDRITLDATHAQAGKTILDAYKEAGLTGARIDEKIQNGEAQADVNQFVTKQRDSVEQLREYAKAVENSYGRDSEEYKAAYRNALDGMATHGGYGVTKDSDGNFNSAKAGKLDPDTLVPVTQDRAWIDPVTGRFNVEVNLNRTDVEMKPLSETQDYSALWASGRSANPPTGGGSSVFGDGSGVSAGMFGGLQLVARDDNSGDAGARLFDGGNGFALIAYSDGTGRVVNRETNEVIWLTPEDTKKLLETVPIAAEPNPVPPPLPKDPPPDYTKVTTSLADEVLETVAKEKTDAVKTDPQVKVDDPTKQVTTDPQVKVDDPAKQVTTDPQAVDQTGTETPNPQIEVNNPTKQVTTDPKAGEKTGATDNTLATKIDALAKQVTTDTKAVEKGLLDKIAENEAAGLTRDQATQKAVTDLATQLGTTKDAILKQIGATETTLATKVDDLAKQVTADTKAVEKSLLDKIAENEAAGQTRDQATQKAITDLSTELGTTKEAVLKQIGATETTLATKVDDLAKQVTKDTKAVEKSLLDKIAENEAAGLTRDQATQKAVTDLATQLGTTKEAILKQIGTTEANLATQITGLSTDLQTKYDALTAGQRALADQLKQQGQTTEAAIAAAQTATQGQIDAAASALTGQITGVGGQVTGLAKDLQGKYDSLTQGQKDLADLLTRQGVDLGQAIATAAAATDKGFNTVYERMAADRAANDKAIADAAAATQAKIATEAEATRQAQATEAEAARQRADAQAKANAAQALRTQRTSNLNNLVNMLGQAGDTGGQQATVKQADPAKIGYVYDFNSIFANPSQEKMFVSPFAQGGMVDDSESVNDELLKLLKG
jgi:phosphopantetheinyl transferase